MRNTAWWAGAIAIGVVLSGCVSPFGGNVTLLTRQAQPYDAEGVARTVAARQWNFVKDTSGAAWFPAGHDDPILLSSLEDQIRRFQTRYDIENRWLGDHYEHTDTIVCVDPIIVVRTDVPIDTPSHLAIENTGSPTFMLGVDAGRVTMGRGLTFGRSVPAGDSLAWYAPVADAPLEPLRVDDGTAWIDTWWGGLRCERDGDLYRVRAER